MIKITTPERYKRIPWKNGKGITTELAISEGGTIDQFDWRISMARVVEDGPFSDFSGYMRNLVLIDGNGIELRHDDATSDHLDALLSFATFDGGCKTVGHLKSGPITDLNIMTNSDSYQVTVWTSLVQCEIKLSQCDHCIIFGLNQQLDVSSSVTVEQYVLPAGHLMQISEESMQDFTVTGEAMVVVYLTDLRTG